VCDESRLHGVGLTKSFGRRVVKNSIALTISPKNDITLSNTTNNFYIQDSVGQPFGSPNDGKSQLSNLITVTSDGDAVTYVYDPNEDRFHVRNDDNDVVGNVTLSKVSGGFGLVDGAIIDPDTIFANGSIKAVLKNVNGQNAGEAIISVSQ